MTPRFKVGDRVRIKSCAIDSVKLIGELGTVEDVDFGYCNPYYVRFDNDELNQECESGWLQDLFLEEELEFEIEPSESLEDITIETIIDRFNNVQEEFVISAKEWAIVVERIKKLEEERDTAKAEAFMYEKELRRFE